MNRILTAAILIILAAFSASAQALPAPDAPRGAHANAVPYYVPPELAHTTRAESYTVTTTDDENTSCDPDVGTGRSLREALEQCSTGAFTVYVPAGTYTLTSSEIIPTFTSLMIVGEGVYSTIITAAPGSSGMLLLTPTGDPVSILNMTFTGGHSVGDGGAIFYVGSGAISVDNVIFDDNTAGGGGAVELAPGGGSVQAHFSDVTFTDNTATLEGGALRFLATNGGENTLSISNGFIQTNSVLPVDCGTGNGHGGAVSVQFVNTASISISIDDTLFRQNTSVCGGGGMYLFDEDGGSTVSVTNSRFDSNSASDPASAGGGLGVYNAGGTLTVSNTFFKNNSAGSGGGLWDAASLRVDIGPGFDSNFIGNHATAPGGGYGGAIAADSNDSLSIVDTWFLDNTAVYAGGAIKSNSNPVFISSSSITNNSAGDVGGYGGGLSLFGDGGVLQNTIIEDNTAQYSPDCDDFNSGGGDLPIVSLGGNSIGHTGSLTPNETCDFIAQPTDMIDNLLVNGGFEIAQTNPVVNVDIPAGWTIKKPKGDKRVCDAGTSFNIYTPHGHCAFMITGGAAGFSLSQTVSPAGFNTGDVLTLFAMGYGGKASKVSLTLTVAYAGPTTTFVKKKITLGKSTGYAPKSATLTLTSAGIAGISVKITDASKSGKFFLERVYLTRTDAGTRAAEGGLLPPPGAPSGMRGGN